MDPQLRVENTWSLGNLKGFKNEITVAVSNKDNETLCILSILKEPEVKVTVSSLESLLLFITGLKGQTKTKQVISNLQVDAA